MAHLYAGTDQGLWSFQVGEEGLSHITTTLSENAVRDVAVDPDDPTVAYAACGYQGWGLHKITDSGHDVTELGLGDRWVWGITISPDGTLLVGTEPPGIYRSTDAGKTLKATPGIEELAADAEWFFWHEPYEAGHVHGFGIHPDHPERIFAGVEIGGGLYSDDGDDTWTTIETLNGLDVHNFAPDPTDPDRWYVATGDGLFGSDDGGTTWRPVTPLDDSYVAKVAFDARNRPCVSAAPDSKTDVGTFWRRDERWSALQTSPANSLAGMIATHPADPAILIHTESTPERCRLLISRDGGETWIPEGPDLPRVRTLAMA